jgi:hypothetical protein
MAKRVFATQGAIGGLNPLGSAATTATYMSLLIPSTAATAALCDVLEVLISGTAAASAIGGFFLVRASTLATTTPSALVNPNSDGGMLPSITALAQVIGASISFNTTQPTLSSAITDAKLNLGLNTFGGIIRWNAAPTQQWQLAGLTAPGAQSVLSNITGGGAQATTVNAHIIYEPY